MCLVSIFDRNTSNLLNLISFSGPFQGVIEEAQRIMNLYAYKILRIPKARFSFCVAALTRIWIRIIEIVLSLETMSNPQTDYFIATSKRSEIKGLLSFFTDPQTLYRIPLAISILEPINLLNVFQQKSNSIITEVAAQVELCRSAVNAKSRVITFQI